MPTWPTVPIVKWQRHCTTITRMSSNQKIYLRQQVVLRTPQHLSISRPRKRKRKPYRIKNGEQSDPDNGTGSEWFDGHRTNLRFRRELPKNPTTWRCRPGYLPQRWWHSRPHRKIDIETNTDDCRRSRPAPKFTCSHVICHRYSQIIPHAGLASNPGIILPSQVR